MFCRHCGKELENDSKFCRQCGKPCQETQQIIEPPIDTSLNDQVKLFDENSRSAQMVATETSQENAPVTSKAKTNSQIISMVICGIAMFLLLLVIKSFFGIGGNNSNNSYSREDPPSGYIQLNEDNCWKGVVIYYVRSNGSPDRWLEIQGGDGDQKTCKNINLTTTKHVLETWVERDAILNQSGYCVRADDPAIQKKKWSVIDYE